MPMPFADHTGKKYGFWTVLSFHDRTKHNQPIWICECVCGTKKPVIMSTLTGGKSRSCGCKAQALSAEKTTKHGHASTPTYKSWHAMKQRCEGKGGHASYVERGITVCDRWLEFENFLQDMGLRPHGTTLDRIDNAKGYEPSNCRWADHITQANNRDTCVKQSVNNEFLTIAEAARKYGKHISGVRHRVRKGWTLADAVTTPMRNGKGLTWTS